jgi:peroxiredoxin
MAAKQLPSARSAPQVGQKAPEFTLVDTKNTNISLSELLSTPLPGASGGAPKGVLLVFYRGYW